METPVVAMLLIMTVACWAVVRAKNAHIADLNRQLAWYRNEWPEDDEGDEDEECVIPPFLGLRVGGPRIIVGPN